MDGDPWKWAGHIYASYAAVAFVLAVLLGWLIVDGRMQLRRLKDLEARGVKRRSSSASSKARIT